MANSETSELSTFNEDKNKMKENASVIKDGCMHYRKKYCVPLVALYVLIWLIYATLGVTMAVYGFQTSLCPMNVFIHVFLLIVPLLILLALLFHALFLVFKQPVLLLVSACFFLLVFFMCIAATIIIAITITRVNFYSRMDIYHCSKPVYLIFYWFTIIHDVIFLCIFVFFIMASCFMAVFTTHTCQRHHSKLKKAKTQLK